MVHNENEHEYPFPVVGIGASAGGLNALEAFFKEVPINTGCAFVVVQHLSHDFKSLMDTLLARYTDLPISIIEDGMYIRPNQIFLIPSGTFLTVQNRQFSLEKYDTDKIILRHPIDHFFTSLAFEAGAKAVGVILSGAGSDGSRGIMQIQEAGGLVLAQKEESAKFDPMPRAAIETGAVDIILQPEKMCEAIVNSLNGKRGDASEDEEQKQDIITTENAFSVILTLLRKRFRVDFRHYKMPTILRRIERRMQLSDIDGVEKYVQFLQEDNRELEYLYRDILVDVTYFFRDLEAFEWLEEEGLPKLLQGKKEGDLVRVWVAGCATGEEAYSLGILLDTVLKSLNLNVSFKIFATDLHQDSIRKATLGYYDVKVKESIPERFYKEYFYEENGRLYIERHIRQSIIFAPHDLLKDSPFTNLDIITCRNVLIYMSSEAQQRVLHQFHFGLRKNSLLFLGPSEYLGSLSNDFSPRNRVWRIFSKNSNRRLIDMSSINLTRRNAIRTGRNSTRLPTPQGWELPLLGRYVPDSILVDQQWYLVRTFGNGVRYLSLPTGRVDLLITRLINPDLITPLRAALYRASQEKRVSFLERVRIKLDGEPTTVELKVIPFVDSKENAEEHYERRESDFFLIEISELLTQTAVTPPNSDSSFQSVINSNEMRYIEELERELSFTRESLQTTIEELESTNEELQSSNEELLAANEELQSTNEELHSVNEELYTVNSEYILQNEQLVQLHEDVQNLQRSTHAISIYLDKKRTIKEFTEVAAKIFGLLPQDNGRPFSNLILFDNLPLKILNRIIDQALQGHPSHFNIVQRQNPYLLQVFPFYTPDEKDIEGVILKLEPLTDLLSGENFTFNTRFGLKSINQINPVMIYIYDVKSQTFAFINWAVREILGYKAKYLVNKLENEFLSQFIHPDDQEAMIRKTLSLDEAPDGTVFESQFRVRDNQNRWRWIRSKEVAFSRNDLGHLTQYIGSAIDVTSDVETQLRAEVLEKELRQLKKEIEENQL